MLLPADTEAHRQTAKIFLLPSYEINGRVSRRRRQRTDLVL